MKLFLINVPGQPVQNAITAYIFSKTHFAVYGQDYKLISEWSLGKKKTKTNLLVVTKQNYNDVQVTKTACYDLWLKNIKDTLQQIKYNVRGKIKKTCYFCICSELIWGNHRAIVTVLCTAYFWFSGRSRCVCAVSSVFLWLLWWEVAKETLVQPSGLFAPNQSCFFL